MKKEFTLGDHREHLGVKFKRLDGETEKKHSREYVECVHKRLSMGISIHSLEHNVNNYCKSI